MKASELKIKLAKIPDDYVFVSDYELHGFVLNHTRKEFTTTAFTEAEAKQMTEENKHLGNMEFV